MIYMYYPSLFRKKKNELIFWTTCGPATTFDPKITGVDGTWYFDDGTTLAAASGVEIFKTFAAEGLHRAVYRPASGGLAAISRIDVDDDFVTRISDVSRLTAMTALYCHLNAALVLSVDLLPPSLTTIAVRDSGAGVVGTIDRFPSCQYYLMNNLTSISGSLASISRSAATVWFAGCVGVTGSVADLPASTVQAYLYGGPFTSGSIAHLIVIRDIRIYSMGWLTADVDTVIDSMWAARAKYTYATPALQIGGTNEAPTGNVAAPTEGADWTEDTPGHWLPRTTGAKAYDLAKDVNGEGFKKWTITYTGGSIAP